MGFRLRPVTRRDLNWTAILPDLRQRRVMGIYLRTLAIIYAWALLIHLGNLLGYGDVKWIQMPLVSKAEGVYFALLDAAIVVGLWKRASWGVVCFIVAAVSRLVLYLGFPDLFVTATGQPLIVRDVIAAQVIALTIFFGLLAAKK